jgi:hypothetical protein
MEAMEGKSYSLAVKEEVAKAPIRVVTYYPEEAGHMLAQEDHSEQPRVLAPSHLVDPSSWKPRTQEKLAQVVSYP